MTNYRRKSGIVLTKQYSAKLIVFTCMYVCRQANLRYRELNESLETVHKKLGDARVSCNVRVL